MTGKDTIIEAMARAFYNDYWDGSDKWPDATDNERRLYISGSKAAYEAMLKVPVDEAFVVERIWRLFDQFQSPTIGNRSPSAEASAKAMAKRVFEALRPYLRSQPESVNADLVKTLKICRKWIDSHSYRPPFHDENIALIDKALASTKEAYER